MAANRLRQFPPELFVPAALGSNNCEASRASTLRDDPEYVCRPEPFSLLVEDSVPADRFNRESCRTRIEFRAQVIPSALLSLAKSTAQMCLQRKPSSYRGHEHRPTISLAAGSVKSSSTA